MIHRTLQTWQVKSWQEELQALICCPKALLKRLDIDDSYLPEALRANTLFPLKATESYVSRIETGNPQDPLLMQILPLAAEFEQNEQFSLDPLEEKSFQPVPGIIHKYTSRVLFIAATQCAIHCRYCFRRHFAYDEHKLNRSQWLDALTYIKKSPNVNEVILSGGDPLSISDKQLSWLVEHIADIPHITRIRVHTRYPVILPSRITTELIEALTQSRLQAIMVIHCNHAQEIDDEVSMALLRLKEANITMLNQSVLLKGINNCAQNLSALSEKLFKSGVLPYYLHLLDKVSGASHFEVKENDARAIYTELMSLLPGYLVPKLVKEQPSEKAKTLIPLYRYNVKERSTRI